MQESRRNWQNTNPKTSSIVFQDLGLKTLALCLPVVLPDKIQLHSLCGPPPAILTEGTLCSVGDHLLKKELKANFTGVPKSLRLLRKAAARGGVIRDGPLYKTSIETSMCFATNADN